MPAFPRSPRLPALAALGALALADCAPSPRPPETFDWAGRAVRFAPPPAGWRREGYNQGGWLGVYFVRERSVGERMLVAEHHPIGERDRRATLREVLERFDAYEEDGLRRAVRLSRCRTDDPLSPAESEVAARVNESLDRATRACLEGDLERARREVEEAARRSEELRISLADVIRRVEFRPETRQEPGRWMVNRRRKGWVGGRPAVFVDYSYSSPERIYSCRDAYFVHDNHLFTASFHGLERNLPVFDRLVESIRFPASTGSGR